MHPQEASPWRIPVTSKAATPTGQDARIHHLSQAADPVVLPRTKTSLASPKQPGKPANRTCSFALKHPAGQADTRSSILESFGPHHQQISSMFLVHPDGAQSAPATSSSHSLVSARQGSPAKRWPTVPLHPNGTGLDRVGVRWPVRLTSPIGIVP